MSPKCFVRMRQFETDFLAIRTGWKAPTFDQSDYAERDASETIISLVDLIDRVRRLKAELTAAHPNQISRRNRRADLLAHIIEGKVE